MPFDSAVHAANHAFAASTRERVVRLTDGSKKTTAHKHLHAADVAERINDEPGWILAISRAARAIE